MNKGDALNITEQIYYNDLSVKNYFNIYLMIVDCLNDRRDHYNGHLIHWMQKGLFKMAMWVLLRTQFS